MENKPAITFAIPFYSGIEYLRQAIDSVLAQTLSNWELIVVDDAGPSPEAERLIESHNDSRIRYYRNENNLGLAKNWNRCLELSNSKYTTILHSDDRLKPEYAKKILTIFKKHPTTSIVFCDADIIDSKGNSKFSIIDKYKKLITPVSKGGSILFGQTGLSAILKGNFIICPTICYSLERIKGERFDASWKMDVDLEFTTRLLLKGHSLLGISSSYYEYRRHCSNETNKLTENLVRFQEELKLYKIIEQKSLKLGWTHASSIAKNIKIIKLTLLYFIVADIGSLNFKNALHKLSLLKRLIFSNKAQ